MNVSMSMFVFLLFMSLKISYCIQNNKIISCPEAEKQSLLSFKQSVQQDPSNLLYSWNDTEINCCKWRGVVCNNLTGHVHQLHLQNGDLSGKINPSLLNLKHLSYLDLSQNNFVETTFPSFIGSMRSLEYLNFSGAGFYGHFPQSIVNLSSLHTLALEGNPLYVDSLEWLSGLSKLEYLNMNYVNLSKAAEWSEQVINKLPSLIELHLRSCSLNNFTSYPLSDANNNITTSNLAILDLSSNYADLFDSSKIAPRWIFMLSNLIYLDLSSNLFEGPIPFAANTTKKLQHIDLSFNNLNSSIPEWLYSCKHLRFFDLSSNQLSGKIPREFSNLCKMRNIDLSHNNFEGEISDSLRNMSSGFSGALESLNMRNNKLSGHLTRRFGEFKSLRTLDLALNSLSGVIPNNIGNLSSLEHLSLGDNKLTGNLPVSMGRLSKLTSLSVEDNLLEGVVNETHFAHLSNLTHFLASGNNLTLKVSQNWIPPFKMVRLKLGSWNLNSHFPLWLETQRNNIQDLDLSNTGIHGSVPIWLLSLSFLELSYNQLHGNIPVITDPEDGSYQFIYLSSNKFSGPLPRIGKMLSDLDLSINSFSGDLSLFLCNTTTFDMRNIDLGGNQLTGEIPPDCFMKWSSLTMLNLGNNNFSGKIPNSIGLLSNLKSFNLQRNNFSGRIPFSIRNCTELVIMNLANNNLVGNMPEWIDKTSSQLTILILRSNRMSGEITSAICNLSSLQILDLSGNEFHGVIPRCVNNFTAMTTERSLTRFYYSTYHDTFLDSVSIATKGRELTYDTILLLVTNIDLSNNNFSGDIPNEITSLVELRSLNLSRNQLTGLIPYNIGNMKQLESLDISTNSLSGELPNSLTAMSSLNYLDLSYNNFTGRIPQSTQITGLNESSFIGNNLCGPPVTSSCNNDGKSPRPTTHTDDQGQGGDRPKIEWLYVFVSLGYAFGLSAFLTTCVLKKSWREKCYEMLENIVYKVHSRRRRTRASIPRL